jgi:hypothetical protein
MYVLEMNGEHVSLLQPPDGFKAKVWWTRNKRVHAYGLWRWK